ncbi:MAG: CPBP family intramembrane metalloprotease [Candidatus Omnitrophica bacterium]|nr:CPBP family intramembrane metalloprotease [Candidatus Omnitrophota bacterium]
MINYPVEFGPLISALWGLKEVLFLFILLFFSEACTTTIGIFASGFVHFNEAAKDLWVLTSSLLRDLAAVGFVFWIVKKKSAGIFSSIGLSTKDFLRNVRTGLLGYTAVIPALLVLLLGAALFWQTFSVEPPPQPVVEIYLKKSTEPFLLFLTFFVAAAGPVMEEILFRGFAYTAFRSRWGARAAGLGSAAIFAAMHGSLVAFVPIFFLGFFLAVLFEKTRSLVPSMTAHVAHNLVMVGMTLFFKTMSV